MMGAYPVEVRRCQHIKVNGTQCGSPALRKERFCYHHQECRSKRVDVHPVSGVSQIHEVLLPPFEDASSIQLVIRQVTELILGKKIDYKAAGLALYALQIASSNLKQMNAEKPRPTQVVVDPETVEETPLGQTPWSASGEGHDPEEEEEEEEEEGEWEDEDDPDRGWGRRREWLASPTGCGKTPIRP